MPERPALVPQPLMVLPGFSVGDRVITQGSPVVGGPFTTTAGRYRANGTDFDQIDRLIGEREQTSIRLPIAAVDSTLEAIVE